MAVQDKQFVGWVLGISGTVFVSALSVVGVMLFNGNAELAVMNTEIRSLKGTVAILQVALDKGTSERYTSSDAIRDRSSLLDMMSKMIERNNQQDVQIMQLTKDAARVEAILDQRKLGT